MHLRASEGEGGAPAWAWDNRACGEVAHIFVRNAHALPGGRKRSPSCHIVCAFNLRRSLCLMIQCVCGGTPATAQRQED